MILYYTGTGNSAYVAKRLAALTGDTALGLNERIRNNDHSSIECGEALIFVTPTYAWRIPRIVREYIMQTEFIGVKTVRFVMDCGSEIGNAAAYNTRIARQKGWKYLGTAQVIMPENYIVMFSAPDRDEAGRIIAAAGPVIERIGKCIRNGKPFDPPRNNLMDRAMSTMVNPIFYALFVKAKAFTVSDTCISCGKCVKLCPMNNIELRGGRPVWGTKCTHCMACICYCPKEAIEYGKKSVGQPRYKCETE